MSLYAEITFLIDEKLYLMYSEVLSETNDAAGPTNGTSLAVRGSTD